VLLSSMTSTLAVEGAPSDTTLSTNGTPWVA
jgi:hypothetical protein